MLCYIDNVNNEKTQEILTKYKEMVLNIKEALRIAGMPERMITIETMNFPDYDKMIPEDVIKLYREVFRFTILYLHKLGFSYRQITTKLGGNSYVIIQKTIAEMEKKYGIKKATLDEVEK